MSDLIDRQEALSALSADLDKIPMVNNSANDMIRRDERIICINTIKALSSAQQWIPVRMRTMDDEEREYWEEHAGFTLTDDMAQTFDCPMPEDGQRVWVQTKNGFVFDDVCDSDCDGIGLEGNGDWDDIVAWMPMNVPKPWEGEDDDEVR